MRQFFCKKYAYCMAAMLAGVVSFSSCSNDDELIDNGPAQSGEVVKTQFAINIPVAGGANTRLGGDIVQGATPVDFRGITNIRLIPFALQDASAGLSGTSSSAFSAIGLPSFSTVQDQGNYTVYNDVEVPLNTNYFLFYGEAIEADGTGSLQNGSLIPSYETGGWPENTALSNVTFQLESILGNDNSISTAQATLTAMLVDIAAASVDGGAEWSTTTEGDMKTYYDNYVSLKAGSANSIKAALQDLYDAMKSSRVSEGSATGLKNEIIAKIEQYFTASETSTGSGEWTLAWKDNTSVKAYENFPSNLGLPDGSMQLVGTSAFTYVEPGSSVVNGNLIQQTAYANYVYPASLFYTVATPIKTHSSTLTNGGVYTGTINDWGDVLGLYTENTSAVSTTTQSIALTNEIRYSVASLNLFVRFADTYIYDNGDEWPGSDPIGQIAVPVPAEGFPLDGILIGGQKNVGWDFKTLTGEQTQYTIYDASMPSDAAVKKATAQSTTPTSYSLALETAGESGEKVRFALEMTNASGAAFVGQDGFVPADGKFYLVGELEATTDHPKVFEQYHKTVANVTITSLKNAYNTIPDLREPQLELGLSVNLEWEQGLVDDVEIQ